jgi:Tfp pilus assembly protein PilF
MSHREIDLCNLALCYNKTGNSEKAEHYYNIALEEFPDCIYAKNALERMHPVRNQYKSKSKNRGKHKARMPRKR